MRLVPSPMELVQPLPVTVRSAFGGWKILFALGFCNTMVFTAVVQPVSAMRSTAQMPALIEPRSTRFIGCLIRWFFSADSNILQNHFKTSSDADLVLY